VELAQQWVKLWQGCLSFKDREKSITCHLNDSSVSLLFKTHPHTGVRLTKLDAAMGERFDGFDDGRSLPSRLYKIQ